MKRGRLPSSSEDSDDNGSLSTTWSQSSRPQHRRDSCSGHEDRKPSEVFRTDLITAMKLHDSCQLSPDEYCVLADPWRQEWEKGVQVPVSPATIPQPVARVVSEEKSLVFVRPKKYIVASGSEPPELGCVDIRSLADSVCRYDLTDMDAAWLELTNEEFKEMGVPELDEDTMERVLEEFEQRCYESMSHAIETQEGLGIEYDEDVVCDVCQSPDGEDGNEMVFCDKCDICVHQACYGILKVPEGSWLCRTCALGLRPRCLLCPKKGGAMKPTRSGTKWVHVSCALWIPEVSIGSPEKMEPITKVSHIPSSRWALVCSLCGEKSGASIQCSVKNCRTAFHVTCAFDRGLEMKTILAENDEVKFKSYCPKHGAPRRRDEGPGPAAAGAGAPCSPRSPPRGPGADEAPHRGSARKQKLQQLEDAFYSFVDLLDVARALRLPADVVDFLFQYWKLKRKVNFNKPLLAPRRDEDDNLAAREQDALLRRLRLFTHLRQDLERVRNLTYMVTRREKIKRSACRVQEQLFGLYTKLLEQERVSGVPSPARTAALESRLLFNSPAAGPGAPRIEDLKWHSAFFRKRMGASALGPALGRAVPRASLHGGPGAAGPALLRPPDLCGRRGPPEVLLGFEKTLAEARLLSAPPRNGVAPRPGGRGEACPPGRPGRPDGQARPFRQSPRPAQRPPEPGRAAPGPRREAGPRGSGAPARPPPAHAAAKVPTTPASPGKNWGGFRIPKKGERPRQGEAQGGARPPPPGLPYLGLGRAARDREPSPPKPEPESDGYVPDADMSDSEGEAAEGKCGQAGGGLAGGPGGFLRRSVLAS